MSEKFQPYYRRQMHVFGDSFAATKDFIWGTENIDVKMVAGDPSFRDWDHSNPQDYKEIVAERMNSLVLSDSPYTAVMGGNDEWSIKCLKAYQPHIAPDDIVLILTTDPLREWLIPMVPTVGSTINLKESIFVKSMLKKLPPEHHPYVEKQVKAALQYHDYIANDDTKKEALVLAYYARLTYFQKILDRIGCRYLIIPGQADINYETNFPNIYKEMAKQLWDTDDMGMNIHNQSIRVKGALMNVGLEELKDCSADNYDLIMNSEDCWAGMDKRRNHMSKVNHQILADKIIDSFKNNVDLDLTTGFEKGFLTKENCLDPEITIDNEN